MSCDETEDTAQSHVLNAIQHCSYISFLVPQSGARSKGHTYAFLAIKMLDVNK
jgi:hypothetical protein